jgi:hypothetical protein
VNRDYIVTTEIIGTRTWEVAASSPDEAIERVLSVAQQEAEYPPKFRASDYIFPDVGKVKSVELVHDPDLDGSIAASVV